MRKFRTFRDKTDKSSQISAKVNSKLTEKFKIINQSSRDSKDKMMK